MHLIELFSLFLRELEFLVQLFHELFNWLFELLLVSNLILNVIIQDFQLL